MNARLIAIEKPLTPPSAGVLSLLLIKYQYIFEWLE